MCWTQPVFDVSRLEGRAPSLPSWGGIGTTIVSENIFMLPDVPHKMLFRRITVVCLHGGAGLIDIGQRLGKPTIIAPNRALLCALAIEYLHIRASDEGRRKASRD
ncbi:hypothetical protein AURDEDRAFT_167945 [Auricularia subglabra TFB-10046 SS5]|nr:hypothetical protein AURDEDRAFT_167945 [Auricularia subglabra TFB-10046 SS5]